MDELVRQVAEKVGISEDKARVAVETVVNFPYSPSQTTIHDLFRDDERIAVRLSHNGVQRKD